MITIKKTDNQIKIEYDALAKRAQLVLLWLGN
jgi:hypothetical protein